MNVIVVFFGSGGSVLGGVLFIAAIIALIVLGETFWFDVGIALGLVIAGILLLIFNIFGMGGIKDLFKDKKKRIIAYIEIVLTIISLIIGFIFPAKLPEIEFSRFFSMFAQSIWISALILAFNLLYDSLSDGLWFPVTIGLLVLYGIIAGLALMMLFYFTKNTNILKFLAENLNYVDSQYIEERYRVYGKDNMQEIIEEYTDNYKRNELQDTKDFYSSEYYKDYTVEQKDKLVFGDYLDFFKEDKHGGLGYVYDWHRPTVADNSIKIVSFLDYSKVVLNDNNEDYGFQRYYMKIDTDDYTILEIQKEKFEDELAK